MYGLGMSYTDISAHIEDIYQISISTATISAITDKIIDKVAYNGEFEQCFQKYLNTFDKNIF